MSSEAWLRQLMHGMGRETLVAATEDVPTSVWVDDDRVAVPGYYIKVHESPPHRILRDGRIFIFEFKRDGITYRVRAGHRATNSANADYVAKIVRTLLEWIDAGILTWAAAFSPFIREDDAWWRVLRAPPDATREEIEDAYHRRALLVHPDRGGTADAFRQLRDAYERALASLDGGAASQSTPASKNPPVRHRDQ